MALLALLPGLALGCITVGPDYERPPAPTPDQWHAELTRGLAEGKADLRTWWNTLEDPLLDTLMERATQGNLDLKEAVARIYESQARLGVSSGERFPDVDGIGAAQRRRPSNAIEPVIPENQGRNDNFLQLGVDSSWEIDLWGRITRSIESSEAGLEASIEDYRDVLVLLYAEVGTTYVDVRTFQERIRFAEANVKTQRGSLQLTVDRNRAGLVGDLDVRQAEQNLARTEAFIPQLRQGLAQSIHRLGVLIGQPPGTLYTELAPQQPIPVPPVDVVIGVPTEAVRQRPDIRRAERDLASQSAQIGVAKADFFPRLSLLGSFAFEGLRGDSLFKVNNRSFTFGPVFSWNLFDGGRVRNNVRVQDALTEQLLHFYENTVLEALEDVENSLVAFVQESERRDALERSVVASRAAVELVSTLYRTGLTDFQNVLDTERTLFEQEDDLALSEGTVTQNLISVYRSLGGGWSPPPASGASTTP